uniref:Uncharacterized protein n=1 Tax=Anguilla anguilla TaxID=7936 RepID=A0A0E9S6H8_ANGAN
MRESSCPLNYSITYFFTWVIWV